ncbi:hypothetical protein QR305_01005 [Bacteroides finegoldii]|uniref:Uncharacterized protein n=1 Tax=Bacteroides finegoldii CL09T03C10 TaxID=997888 RepID=K5CJ60_9BACE|nr:hypothetical protein HMPREF1057_04068 [Bacteroides finegoldii CL09T03C10]
MIRFLRFNLLIKNLVFLSLIFQYYMGKKQINVSSPYKQNSEFKTRPQIQNPKLHHIPFLPNIPFLLLKLI